VKKIFHTKKNHLTLSFFAIALFFTYALTFLPVFASENQEKNNKIQITADNLNIKSKENSAEFSGNVQASGENFTITADNLKIYYKKDAADNVNSTDNKSIDKIVASGNVLVAADGKIATSENVQYTTKDQILVLTGKEVTFTDGNNSVTGSKIIFNRITGNVKVKRDIAKRVTAILYSNDKTDTSGDLTHLESDKDKTEVKAPLKQSEASAETDMESNLNKVPVPTALGMAETLDITGKGILHKKGEDAPAIEDVRVINLKKIIAFAPFENKTPFTISGFDKKFYTGLMEILSRQCPDYIFQMPGDKNYPLFLKQLSKDTSMGIDQDLLSEKGRKNGLNAIITGALTNIYTDEDSGGLLRKSKKTVNISMEAVVHDINTRAKILNKNFVYKLNIDKSHREKIMSSQLINMDLFKKDFIKNVHKAGKEMAKGLNNLPWMGFMTSQGEDNITIFSGENAGLVPGNILKVYSIKSIKGFQNSNFLMPGDKTGEIKLISVGTDTSKGVLISGSFKDKEYFVKPN